MPKVVMQHCFVQDLNPRPTDRKPKCLTRCTTAPLIYLLHLLISANGRAKSYLAQLNHLLRDLVSVCALPQVHGLAQVLPGPGTTGGERAERLELRAVRQPVDDPAAALLVLKQPRPRTALRLRSDEQHRLPRHLQVHTAMSVYTPTILL